MAQDPSVSLADFDLRPTVHQLDIYITVTITQPSICAMLEFNERHVMLVVIDTGRYPQWNLCSDI